ncbi:MAG TPA: ATP-dependent DNA helicase [Nitrososphaerales archaeon]|nr:ATP-dependent DNA helicase [Nitrososphaerales archaeon]
MQIEDYFAYESFRPNQRELALKVHQNCQSGGVLLAEAMSGFGKTAAVLSGALCAAEETGSKVVYACRTKRQVSRVSEEIALLQKKRPIRAAAMYSKFDYCLLKATNHRPVPQDSFSWYCGFNVSNNLCSFFLNIALLGGRTTEYVDRISYSIPDHSSLLQQSMSAHVCPYEMVKLAVAQAAVIVVPYHFLFDPSSQPTLFGRNLIEPQKVALVVDEAHNLRDFLRSDRSASLTGKDLSRATEEAEQLMMTKTADSLKALTGFLNRVLDEATNWFLDRRSILTRMKQEFGDIWLQTLTFELNACSGAAWYAVSYGGRLPCYILRVGDFLNKLASPSQELLLTKWDGVLGLVNTNPVEDLPTLIRSFQSSTLVSATVNPSEVFLRSIGIDSLLPSVYSVQVNGTVRVRTLLDTGVTTKYKTRSPQMYSRIAGKITAISSSVTGGIGVFAPSYAVLEPVYELTCARLHGRRTLREAPGLSASEANEIAESFRSERGCILFGVQGGRFSEGEDFRGDLMDASVVVGLSLPPPSPQLYAEYTFMKWKGEQQSYLMLALLPGLRKAFQAAGRHLRNPGKKGLVFLLDKRFDSPVVKDLMPSWLKSNMIHGDFSPPETDALVTSFWGDQEEPGPLAQRDPGR